MVAVVVYFITAWNSTGFHSADEHFQIIAFAQWKLGELPMDHLPWEFSAEIRSSLQPWIAALTFKLVSFVGLHDPFTWALLLRLFTACLALLAIRRFVNVVMIQYPAAEQRAFVLLSYGLWFIPFIGVRFSSEGWSAIFLLQSITSVLASEKGARQGLAAGAYGGIAMLCRPPTALVLLALLAWSRFVRRDPITVAVKMVSAATVVLLFGLLLDLAFYGHFAWTVRNYVTLGLFGDPTHRFDELPWYYYAPWIVKYAIPPIGAAILLALVVLLWKRPSHLIVWCAIPYLAVHSFIAHKELRFLYPMAFLVPWLLVEAWTIFRTIIRPGALIRITVALFVLFNMAGLGLVISSAAGEGRVRLAEVLHREAGPGDRIGYVVEPALLWRIELPAFYAPNGVEQVVIDPADTSRISEDLEYLVVQDGSDLQVTATDVLLAPLARTTTRTAETFMHWYTWGEGQRPWTLYRVMHDTH